MPAAGGRPRRLCRPMGERFGVLCTAKRHNQACRTNLQATCETAAAAQGPQQVHVSRQRVSAGQLRKIYDRNYDYGRDPEAILPQSCRRDRLDKGGTHS